MSSAAADSKQESDSAVSGREPTTMDTTAAATTTDSNSTEADEAEQKKSSYYFFKSTPASEAHKYAPKPIERGQSPATDSTPQPITTSNGSNKSGTASAWNTAGTFEERDVTEYAQSTFRKHLVGTTLNSAEGIEITKVSKCEGESTIVWTRGKKKVGYDLQIRMTWSNKKSDDDLITGNIDITELADFNDLDETEIKFSTKTESEGAKELTRKLSKQSKDVILKKIQEFVNDLKAHW